MHFAEDVPVEDDVLAAPLLFHESIIIGHSDGDHRVAILPNVAIHLTVAPFIMELFNDEDEIPTLQL